MHRKFQKWVYNLSQWLGMKLVKRSHTLSLIDGQLKQTSHTIWASIDVAVFRLRERELHSVGPELQKTASLLHVSPGGLYQKSSHDKNCRYIHLQIYFVMSVIAVSPFVVWLCLFFFYLLYSGLSCKRDLDLSESIWLTKGGIYKWGNSLWGMEFIPPVEFHKLGKEHWSCSWGSLCPDSILRHFMDSSWVFPLICHPSVHIQYVRVCVWAFMYIFRLIKPVAWNVASERSRCKVCSNVLTVHTHSHTQGERQ